MRILQYFGWAICLLGTLGAMNGCKQGGDLDADGVKIPHFDLPTDTFREPDLSAFRTAVSKRYAHGDTVPVAREELEQLLPEEWEGYSLEIRDGGKFRTKEYAFSEATYVFYNDQNEYLEITLADYVSDTLFFENPLRRYHLIGGPDFGNETVTKLEVPHPEWNAFGWIAYHPVTHVATLFMGLEYRFALNIEATGQVGTQLVDEVFTRIPIENLYELAKKAQVTTQ